MGWDPDHNSPPALARGMQQQRKGQRIRNIKWQFFALVTWAGALPHTCKTPMKSQNMGTVLGTQ
eukprot:5693102-Heterocapsa_arctica.AAC.1